VRELETLHETLPGVDTGALEEDIDAMNELRELVHRATSERWHPQTVLTARAITLRKCGEANVPASQIVTIDLETKIHSREVL
jgi:hypothetical protein